MKQDVGQLHIPMDNSKGPYVTITLDHLFDNNSSFFLSNAAPDFQEHAEVVAITVILHHVDV